MGMGPDYDQSGFWKRLAARRSSGKGGRGDFGWDVRHMENLAVISGLDHLVVLVEDIEAGTRAYGKLLGCSPAWRSESEGAKAVLFTLANMSLELMAPAGQALSAERIREVIRQSGEGLARIFFRVEDIGKMHRRLDRLALQPEAVADAESRDVSGATLRWKRTRAATELTRGVRMFFLNRRRR